jgi:mono/diheme cytochrome c family protein
VRRLIPATGGLLGLLALCGLVLVTASFVAPRLNWSAGAKPGAFETRIADWVRERWVAIHATGEPNPLAPTPQVLASGREEFKEHCAVCHGLDGSGRNGFHADFYPPVPRLTGDTQDMSDSEIFFVIAKGVALSGMPAFGARHTTEEIWKLVLWIRHLPNLSEQERKEIERQTSDDENETTEVTDKELWITMAWN